jgi:uncharacterized protein
MFDSLILFASFAAAIVLEAAPFLLAGSFLAALVERYAHAERVRRFAPKSLPLQLICGSLLGLLLPTCECGVVPLVRRLLAKGAPPALAVTYMLAAPVVNPVVLISTAVAYQGDLFVVAARLLLVLAPAMVLGAAANSIPKDLLLRPEGNVVQSCGHVHAPGRACGHAHETAKKPALPAILEHTVSEFTGMLGFLVLGAMAAAAFKVFAPQQALLLLADSPYLAIGVMMVLAILLSICSEADAFVASSFVAVPQSAQLAFMGIGPMVDLKLIAMFLAVFHRRFALALIVVPVLMVYVMSLSMAFGGAP